MSLLALSTSLARPAPYSVWLASAWVTKPVTDWWAEPISGSINREVNIMTGKPDIIEVKDGRLHIDVALAENPAVSASGKSRVHFSTHGNKPLEDGYVVGINLYKKS